MAVDPAGLKEKIKSLDRALEWRGSLRQAGLRMVLTNGCFDLLHPGHVQYLAEARALGDALLVAINGDASVRALKGPDRPVLSQEDRAFVLAGQSAVDAVVIWPDSDMSDLFRALRPDLYVKGGDYTVETLDAGERKALTEVGARIRILSLVPGKSTTELLRRLLK